MSASRVVSLVVLIAGLVLLGIAYQQSGTVGDETKHFFTGNYRDKTTWMMVIGGVAGVLGFIGLVAPGNQRAIA